jgi:amino acid transporter
VLQAVAVDNLFPFLAIFKKEACGREPINGYAITFVIATVFIMIGDLNAIAPLISGFFMITYAFINFACFSASYSKSPGWRPSFRFYNKWVALVTAVACIVVLFLLNWLSGLITLGVGFMLKKYLEFKDVQTSWGAGSAMYAIQYNKALTAIVNMNQNHHIKNYRPQLLVRPVCVCLSVCLCACLSICLSVCLSVCLPFSSYLLSQVLNGPLEERQGLQTFSQMLYKSQGIFVYGNVLLSDTVTDIRSVPFQQTRGTQVHSFLYLPFELSR